MKTIALTNMSSVDIVPLTPFQQRAVVSHACAHPDCPDFLREHMAAWLSTGVWSAPAQLPRWFSGPSLDVFWDMLRFSLSYAHIGHADEISDTHRQFAFNLLAFIHEHDVGPVPYASIKEELNVRAASWPSGMGDTITSLFAHELSPDA